MKHFSKYYSVYDNLTERLKNSRMKTDIIQKIIAWFFSARNFLRDHARAIHLVLNNAQNGGKSVLLLLAFPLQDVPFQSFHSIISERYPSKERAYLTIFI